MSSLNNVFSFNKHVQQQQRQQIQVVSRQFIQYICAVGKYLDQPAQSHILSMALRYTSDTSDTSIPGLVTVRFMSQVLVMRTSLRNLYFANSTHIKLVLNTFIFN